MDQFCSEDYDLIISALYALKAEDSDATDPQGIEELLTKIAVIRELEDE